MYFDHIDLLMSSSFISQLLFTINKETAYVHNYKSKNTTTTTCFNMTKMEKVTAAAAVFNNAAGLFCVPMQSQSETNY